MKIISVAICTLVLTLFACETTMDEPGLIRGPIYIETAEVNDSADVPPQYVLSIAGNLPTPCHQLRVELAPPDAENRIIVAVYSESDPDALCAQVLEPFEEDISLTSLSAGDYSVWINGVKVVDFEVIE